MHLDADYLGAYNGFVNGIGTGGRAGGQFHLMNSGNNHGSSGCGGNVNEIKNN